MKNDGEKERKARAALNFNKGLICFRRGKIEEARRFYTEAITLAPSDPKTLLSLGVVYDWLGNVFLAKYYYREGRKRARRVPEILSPYCDLRLAELISRDDPRKALKFLRELKLDGLVQYHMLLGEIYFSLDETEKARRSLERALELDNKHPFSSFLLGVIEGDNREYDFAIPYFKRILKKDPQNETARFNLARSLEYSGRYVSAIREYRKLLNQTGQNQDLETRIKNLEKRRSGIKDRYNRLVKWIKKRCEGKRDVYLDEHPKDTLKKLKQLCRDEIGYSELPVDLRIAALAHDIERADDKRTRKQWYGLPDKNNVPSKDEWEDAYRYVKSRGIGIGKNEWNNNYNDGVALEDPRDERFKKARDILYRIYKQEHSRRSAEIIKEKLEEDGWPEEITERVYKLILHHEEGNNEENPASDRMAKYLRKADAISFFTSNIMQYLENRGIEPTIEKMRINIRDILGNEPTETERDTIEEAIRKAFKNQQEHQRVRMLLKDVREIKTTKRPTATRKVPSQTKDRITYEKERYALDLRDPLFTPTNIAEIQGRETPFMIITHGLTGAGKSTSMTILYNHFSRLLGKDKISLYRSSEVRAELFPRSRGPKDPDYFNPNGKTRLSRKGTYERMRTIEVICEMAMQDLLNGKNVLIDSTFVERTKRDMVYGVAAAVGCNLYILCCECPSEREIKKRLRRRKGKKPEEEASKIEIYRHIKASSQPIEESEFRYGMHPIIVTFDTLNEKLSYKRNIGKDHKRFLRNLNCLPSYHLGA